MKKARMNISHSRFILFKLKIFGEIVNTFFFSLEPCIRVGVKAAMPAWETPVVPYRKSKCKKKWLVHHRFHVGNRAIAQE